MHISLLYMKAYRTMASARGSARASTRGPWSRSRAARSTRLLDFHSRASRSRTRSDFATEYMCMPMHMRIHATCDMRMSHVVASRSHVVDGRGAAARDMTHEKLCPCFCRVPDARDARCRRGHCAIQRALGTNCKAWTNHNAPARMKSALSFELFSFQINAEIAKSCSSTMT